MLPTMTRFRHLGQDSGSHESKAFPLDVQRSTWAQRWRSLGRFLLPSFLTTTPPTKLHGIASLDGLRGFASFGVFQLHFTDTFCQMHNRGFGFDENNYYPIQLPFIHYLWTADSLVATFFVISGYVLSHKPLKQMRARTAEPLLTTMGSAIFRRGFRLFMPTLISMTIAFIMVELGFFNYSHWVFTSGGNISGGEDTPPLLATSAEQFAHFRHEIWDMLYPFNWGSISPSYDPHLWTITIEYKASMLLFLITVGVWNLRTGVRMAFVGLFTLYVTHCGLENYALFFGGMFLAEVDLILREDGSNILPRLRYLWLAMFAFGLYLAGMPVADPAMTPGYKTIMWLMPHSYRWYMIGSFMMVSSVRNSDDLQILFTNRFAQYLGKISYALYIVHGNVRRSLTYAMQPTLLGMTNAKASSMGFAVMVFISLMVTYPVVFFLADVFWRGVDIPSVKFARWLESKSTRKDDDEGLLLERRPNHPS